MWAIKLGGREGERERQREKGGGGGAVIKARQEKERDIFSLGSTPFTAASFLVRQSACLFHTQYTKSPARIVLCVLATTESGIRFLCRQTPYHHHHSSRKKAVPVAGRGDAYLGGGKFPGFFFEWRDFEQPKPKIAASGSGPPSTPSLAFDVGGTETVPLLEPLLS